MQTLTLEGVKAAARDYYDRGLLLFQHGNYTHNQCFYAIEGGYRCSVGAAMDDETISIITKFLPSRNNSRIGVLIDVGIIQVDNARKIAHVQSLHDQILRSINQSPSAVEQDIQKFLEAIDYQPPGAEGNCYPCRSERRKSPRRRLNPT